MTRQFKQPEKKIQEVFEQAFFTLKTHYENNETTQVKGETLDHMVRLSLTWCLDGMHRGRWTCVTPITVEHFNLAVFGEASNDVDCLMEWLFA